MTTQRISIIHKNGQIDNLISEYKDKQFKLTNDIVVKSDDIIWFTDLRYGKYRKFVDIYENVYVAVKEFKYLIILVKF